MQMHLAAPTTDVNISDLARARESAYLRNPVSNRSATEKKLASPLINLFLKINRDTRLLTQ